MSSGHPVLYGPGLSRSTIAMLSVLPMLSQLWAIGPVFQAAGAGQKYLQRAVTIRSLTVHIWVLAGQGYRVPIQALQLFPNQQLLFFILMEMLPLSALAIGKRSHSVPALSNSSESVYGPEVIRPTGYSRERMIYCN